MEAQTINGGKALWIENLLYKLPSLVGTQEYEPTGLQIQVLCAFLETVNRGEQADPISLLAAMGKAKTNWYNWVKKEGFMNWWNQAIEEYFSGHGIREVHASVYRNALGNSSADRKLYLERFDEGYKPVSKTEVEAYPGRVPPPREEREKRRRELLDACVEGSKKRVEAIQEHTNNKE